MAGKRVLVVDDEKLIVKGIRFSLEQDNMEVDCAYDGEEALMDFLEQQLADVQLVGADLVHGADDAAEHVIEAAIRARALDRLHVARLADDADHGAVAAQVLADVALLARGVREAHGAEVHLLLDLEDRAGKAPCLLGVGLEQVVRDALSRLRADAREPAQLVQKTLQRVAVVCLAVHSLDRVLPRPRKGPGC